MSETRQRWRLIVARDEAAKDLVQREVGDAWEAALRATGLPLAVTDAASPRLRITFASPVPVGMLAEREPIDVGLTERHRIEAVRRAVEAVAPTGYRLVDLYDIWPGAPTLAASTVAGDYRAALAVDADSWPEGGPEAAVDALLASPQVPFRRDKAGAAVEVDIRPLILALRAEPAPEGTAGSAGFDLWMRLRLGGDSGVGRPEEVVAALGERLGLTLVVRRVCRERVVLADGPA